MLLDLCPVLGEPRRSLGSPVCAVAGKHSEVQIVCEVPSWRLFCDTEKVNEWGFCGLRAHRAHVGRL